MDKKRYTAADVDVADTVREHDGYFKIDTYRLRHRQFEGGWGPEIRREIFERGHAVAVLPYDPVSDEIVLIEQFRTGAYAALKSGWFPNGASPWLYECVAGIIDPGEAPEEVARREMVEEAGLPVSELIPALHYLATPGGSSESIFVYIGRVDASGVGGLHGLAHEGEDIRPFTIPLADAYKASTEGVMANATTVIAIQWLLLNKARVAARWAD